jgi:hypothetical protein
MRFAPLVSAVSSEQRQASARPDTFDPTQQNPCSVIVGVIVVGSNTTISGAPDVDAVALAVAAVEGVFVTSGVISGATAFDAHATHVRPTASTSVVHRANRAAPMRSMP